MIPDSSTPRGRQLFAALVAPRMVVALLMGFSSGLPLLLTSTLLQAWLTQSGLSLKLIGLSALLGLPYTLEFLWAPIFDRYLPPFLGRRRGWLVITQVCLVVTIALLDYSDPVKHRGLLALTAVGVAFFSASQDMVVNAYRRESLSDKEQAYGAGLYFVGYRAAMLVAGGGGLILASFLSYREVYALMAAAMSVGLVTTFLSPEPGIGTEAPSTLAAAVVQPFLAFFQRQHAIGVLIFVLIYKIGDVTAQNMLIPFYLKLGYTTLQIGTVVKLFGFVALVTGGLAGGALTRQIGTYRALMWFGILQAVATAAYAWLVHTGISLAWLAVVVSGENLTLAMSTAALLGFLAQLTDRRFTATQFALLTSLVGVSRVVLSAPAGYVADFLGWSWFFIACGFMAVPGLLLLTRFRDWIDAAQ